MLSKSDAGKKIGDESGNGRLLNEIEAISKALYLDKKPPRSLIPHSPPTNNRLKLGSNSKHAVEEPPQKEKKSIWNWRPLKAFSHIRNRRFNCCFSLQVHSIEALPPEFEGLSLCVHWKRRDGDMVTRPVKVHNGTAEFGERLSITCSVYGSRSGPHHSAKYEAKHFLLYASVYGAVGVDLGKHRNDLTKLLPVTLEELEEDRSSGKWSTSYDLSGKAKGAVMNVSFSYGVVGDNKGGNNNNNNNGGHGGKYSAPDLSSLRQNNLSLVRPGTKFGVGVGDGRVAMRRADSLPSPSKRQFRAASRSVEDIKDLHEVLPVSGSELASSVDMLYKKLDEKSLDKEMDHQPEFHVFTELLDGEEPHSDLESDTVKTNVDYGCEDDDFSVIEQGVELPSTEPLRPEEDVMGIVEEYPLAGLDLDFDTSTQVDSEDGNNLCSREEKDSAKLLSQEEKDSAKLLSLEEKDSCTKYEIAIPYCSSEDEVSPKELLMKELELALNSVSNLEAAASESADENDNYEDTKSNHGMSMNAMSDSVDDLESVANDFLDMLGMDRSPTGLSSGSETDSPRGRLLRQFEKDSLSAGFPLFGFDMETEDQAGSSYSDTAAGMEWRSSTEDLEFSSIIQAAEDEHLIASQAEKGKVKAKMLEDLETEVLMREYGLNERAFEHSPPKSSSGFGSPIDLPPEQPLELPPLGDGVGPFLQTKNGGFLRSMNPSLFTAAKNGGNLVMQVSSPVVVPAEMGSAIMGILKHLASAGIEKLSMQANKLMPLEDITGKTMHQLACEAMPSLEGSHSEPLSQYEPLAELDNFEGQVNLKDRTSGRRSRKSTSSLVGNEMGSEFVSLDDLAPLAMDKIEALSIEGLRIQSGMCDDDAPSNISACPIGEISALSGSRDLEGAGSLQLLDKKDGADDEIEGLMDLTLTLDEWMRIDSGEISGEEDQISERTSKILAAHHAHSLDFVREGTKGDRRRGGKGRKCGLLGNNFTIAVMVQLRDPMRNYEPVGAPMLSFIQVEREFIPPKPRIYSKVSELVRKSNDDDDEEDASESSADKKEEEAPEEEQGIPRYRITDVHVAGLQPEPEPEPQKRRFWGLWGAGKQQQQQQQSGSRWLVANGMGKSNKNPLLKSKAAPKNSTPSATTKVQPGETLWSISSRVHGTGAKWKELAALNPHIRNPNVIFPNETIRLS